MTHDDERRDSRGSTEREHGANASTGNGSSSVDVFGIGNPLIDVIVRAEDSDLTALDLHKGTMRLVDLEERARIVKHVEGRRIVYACGGSCPNTVIFLSALGVTTALAGKIGNDEFGRQYEKNLPKDHLSSRLVAGKGATGSSVILVTPDSERTMNTYLGANREFSVDDLDEVMIRAARFFYFTGYMWDTELQKTAVLRAIELVRASGGQVAFDVADPFAVDRNTEEFRELIHSRVDVAFANAEEARMLYGAGGFSEVADRTDSTCRLTVLKNGSAGSVVKRRACAPVTIPVRKVKAVDTTGAGDMYAAGFLYGLSRGFTDADAGLCASYLASRIVETWGAQFDPQKRSVVAREVTSEKWREKMR